MTPAICGDAVRRTILPCPFEKIKVFATESKCHKIHNSASLTNAMLPVISLETPEPYELSER
jgi:hypothetical protein